MFRIFLIFAFSQFFLFSCATSQPTAASPQAAAGQQEFAPKPAEPGIDVTAIDRKADPCDDFYAFACGGWIAANEIPADKSRWGRFDQLAESDLNKLHDILAAAAAGKFEPQDRFGDKVGDFFAACMDQAGIEKTGLADLMAEWAKLDPIKNQASLASAVGRLHAAGVGAMFNFFSMQDFKDSTLVIAGIFQGGLSLPDRDYYLKDDPKSAEIRKNFKIYLEHMLTLSGIQAAQAKSEAEAVFELEKTMAASHWTRTEMRSPERIYNPRDLAGLQKMSAPFEWQAYLAALGAPIVENFSISTPKAMTQLGILAEQTPLKTLRAYLRWRVLDGMAQSRALPNAFVDERFAFQSKNFTGQKILEPRWKHCTRMTDRLLGEALGQAFVRRWFAGDARDKALQLIRNVQRAQEANLTTLDWMDAATRQKALQKLAKINNKIGYPSKWRDYASLTVTRASFLKSLLEATSFETRRDLAKIGKPVDRSEWEMTPPTVNAYYNPQLNEMVFPAGILQPTFYTSGANDAVNFGAIGFVMGHELTHGFDDEGRKFDAAGNMHDWWSTSVVKKFEQRTACVEAQFSGYIAVDDVKLNGKLTLGENIADLGGLKLSMAAYRASHKGKPHEAPVGGFSAEQQFFLAAAQVWCAKMHPEEARRRVVLDPHSPPKWRVDGPLSNLPDFAKAFNCKAGDNMVRAKRCEVW
ncbi:MAG TPA: M13 family metallopeptidase [Myxococcota bacterium]|nr:M13 family metallopeptidase [Myxococcota bacterium]